MEVVHYKDTIAYKTTTTRGPAQGEGAWPAWALRGVCVRQNGRGRMLTPQTVMFKMIVVFKALYNGLMPALATKSDKKPRAVHVAERDLGAGLFVADHVCVKHGDDVLALRRVPAHRGTRTRTRTFTAELWS